MEANHVERDRHFSPFGRNTFGRYAEGAARFFGTPQYIVGQTIAVAVWVVLNSIAVIQHWDPYPFILLNLAFSLQAAYAAPLILLAQTRQADRDKTASDAIERHREESALRAEQHQLALEHATKELRGLLEQNTELTRSDRELTGRVEMLAREIRTLVGPA